MTKKKLILILIVATFFAYLSSLGNPFIWDDEQFITKNAYVQNFDLEKIFTTNTIAGAGVISDYYRPLTTLSFAIDAKIWGQNSFGFHLFNLALHIGAGILLFGILGELGISEIPAFFIALFFLIHPVQVEAVSYINSRGDSLYTVFFFLSLLIFTKGVKTKLGLMRMIWVVVTFLASLLSKEIALAGIGLFPLILFLQNKEKVINKYTNNPINECWYFLRASFYKNKAALLIIGLLLGLIVLYLVLRLTVLDFGNTLNFSEENNFYTTHLFVRLFTFCKVLWIYLGLLVWPYPLHMERSVELIKSFWSPWVLGILSLLGGLGILGIFELQKKATGWILFGLLWFLCMLVPSSGIIPINGILYEHWLYEPMIGFWIVVYGIGEFIWGPVARQPHIHPQGDPGHRAPRSRATPYLQHTKYKILNTFRKVVILFGILIAIFYIVLTIRQNNIWSDPITFYMYTLSFAPDSAKLHNNLGMSYADIGSNNKAIAQYKIALQLGSNYTQIYNNLGNAQALVGDYQDAQKNLQKALVLSPQFVAAKTNLIMVYILTKQFTKATVLAGNNSQLLQIIENSKKSSR